MKNRLVTMHEMGQSPWYDNIERRLLDNGELAGMIERGDIRGVTSNPSIFNNAIAKTHDYDAALAKLASSRLSAAQIFDVLAIEDITRAADLFLPLYHQSGGGDGFVSLEVSPTLAHDTAGTAAEAKRLWQTVGRPNLMIKIPATLEGLPAIRQTIAAGINVNVTLIFSIERHLAVMEAFLAGLEDRAAAGLPLGKIASVASFFISRMDTKTDKLLNAIAQTSSAQADLAASLRSKLAIANARLAYQEFRCVFASQRFAALQAKGAEVQRPLWASTSTKAPSLPDTLYVDELIGPHTVNTMPPATLDAYRDHGLLEARLENDLPAARQAFADLASLGISLDQITAELEAEGVKSFADAFTALLQSVETRRAAAHPASRQS